MNTEENIFNTYLVPTTCTHLPKSSAFPVYRTRNLNISKHLWGAYIYLRVQNRNDNLPLWFSSGARRTDPRLLTFITRSPHAILFTYNQIGIQRMCVCVYVCAVLSFRLPSPVHSHRHIDNFLECTPLYLHIYLKCVDTLKSSVDVLYLYCFTKSFGCLDIYLYVLTYLAPFRSCMHEKFSA